MRVAAAVRPWLAGARRSLVVTVLAALTLTAAAVPAYAEVGVTTVSTIGTWIRYDDFMVVGTPSNPAPPINRWEIQGDGHFSLNSEWANSGSQYAYLRTNGSMNSFVRTTFDFPSRNMRGCTAWFAGPGRDQGCQGRTTRLGTRQPGGSGLPVPHGPSQPGVGHAVRQGCALRMGSGDRGGDIAPRRTSTGYRRHRHPRRRFPDPVLDLTRS